MYPFPQVWAFQQKLLSCRMHSRSVDAIEFRNSVLQEDFRILELSVSDTQEILHMSFSETSRYLGGLCCENVLTQNWWTSEACGGQFSSTLKERAHRVMLQDFSTFVAQSSDRDSSQTEGYWPRHENWCIRHHCCGLRSSAVRYVSTHEYTMQYRHILMSVVHAHRPTCPHRHG